MERSVSVAMFGNRLTSIVECLAHDCQSGPERGAPKVNRMLIGEEEAVRADVLSLEGGLKASLEEELRHRLSFWKEIPYQASDGNSNLGRRASAPERVLMCQAIIEGLLVVEVFVLSRRRILSRSAAFVRSPTSLAFVFPGGVFPSRVSLVEAMGLYGVRFGLSEDLAKECAARCVVAFDEAVADGKAPRMHRLAKRLFSGDGWFRRSVEAFASGTSLDALASLDQELMAICSASLTERSIEGEHARIKKFGLGKEGTTTPATVAAQLRWPEVMRLLDDEGFCNFGASLWNKPLMVHKVLNFLVPSGLLTGLSQVQVFKKVYMYDMEEHFRGTDEEEAQRKAWDRLVVVHSAPSVAQLAWHERLFLAYIKDRAHAAKYIALPRDTWLALSDGRGDTVLEPLTGHSPDIHPAGQKMTLILVQADSGFVSSAHSEPALLRVVSPSHTGKVSY